jgi:hypothetical protein
LLESSLRHGELQGSWWVQFTRWHRPSNIPANYVPGPGGILSDDLLIPLVSVAFAFNQRRFVQGLITSRFRWEGAGLCTYMLKISPEAHIRRLLVEDIRRAKAERSANHILRINLQDHRTRHRVGLSLLYLVEVD